MIIIKKYNKKNNNDINYNNINKNNNKHHIIIDPLRPVCTVDMKLNPPHYINHLFDYG